jgi:hypothetical protein
MTLQTIISERKQSELMRTFPALSMALWRGDVSPAERLAIMRHSIERSAQWRRLNAWQYDHPRHCAMVRAYHEALAKHGEEKAGDVGRCAD